MRPRVSILNLLLATTIVALVIVVVRLYRALDEERFLRVQLLQKGGILEVTNPDVVHLVQVSTSGEDNSLRWRVYVPNGHDVILNARVDSLPFEKPVVPRLPPNAIVVAERASPNPIHLSPGENVISLSWKLGTPYLTLDVVGSRPRRTRSLGSPGQDFDWLNMGYGNDITRVEQPMTTLKDLRDGRTVTLHDGKTFVLCRYREWILTGTSIWKRIQRMDKDGKQIPADDVGEVIVWLHPDG